MKLMIGDYEVKVTARGPLSDKMNAKDTKYFLNMISGALYSSSTRCESEGWEFRAKDEAKMATDIHDTFGAKGFYDDIRKKYKLA